MYITVKRQKNKKGNNIYHRKTHNVQHESVRAPTLREEHQKNFLQFLSDFHFPFVLHVSTDSMFAPPVAFHAALRGSYLAGLHKLYAALSFLQLATAYLL